MNNQLFFFRILSIKHGTNNGKEKYDSFNQELGKKILLEFPRVKSCCFDSLRNMLKKNFLNPKDVTERD